MKKIVIVDDEISSINCIKNAISKYIDAAEVVGTATDIEDGIHCININKPDILLLDIDLGTGTGFDLLKAFETRYFDVIFITAYSNYAIRAFKICAIDFLLKPFEIMELKDAIDRAGNSRKTLEHSRLDCLLHNHETTIFNQKIALPQQFGYEFMDINDIFYLIADGNYVNIIHKKGKPDFFISKPLTYFENILNKNMFLRTHNSYLVNMLEVKSYIRGDGGSLVINNGARIPVSRKNKPSILKRINNIALYKEVPT